MYLHIGNNYSVDTRDIIGIFDIENTTVGKCTKKLLERAEKNHICVYATYEMPKSFIITMNQTETIPEEYSIAIQDVEEQVFQSLN